jgi:hypothetical protein
VTITGKTPIPEEELKKRFGLKTGKDYDFFRLRKGMDRVKDAFTKKGYPEATVRSERKPPVNNKVDITLAVEAGDPVQFVYEGSDMPGGVRRKVEKAWSQNSFDSLRSRQAKAVLQATLRWRWLLRGHRRSGRSGKPARRQASAVRNRTRNQARSPRVRVSRGEQREPGCIEESLPR